MRCPYLSSESKRKKCTKMIGAGLSEEISDFEYEHYCDGNPIYCYFYRVAERARAKGSSAMAKHERLRKKLREHGHKSETIDKIVDFYSK